MSLQEMYDIIKKYYNDFVKWHKIYYIYKNVF